MTNLIEGYLPFVQYHGLNTNQAVAFGSTLSVAGATTFNGNVVLAAGKTITGGNQNVISGSGATVTLTAAQSGSAFLFDRAAGIVVTLPAPAVGLWFEFIYVTSVTSNAYTIVTDAGTTFVSGGIQSVIAASATTLGSVGNGSTHVKVTSNGTTTGGLAGSALLATCVSSTLWSINGIMVASGALATPFST